MLNSRSFHVVPTRFFLCFCLCLSHNWEPGLRDTQRFISVDICSDDLGRPTEKFVFNRNENVQFSSGKCQVKTVHNTGKLIPFRFPKEKFVVKNATESELALS